MSLSNSIIESALPTEQESQLAEESRRALSAYVRDNKVRAIKVLPVGGARAKTVTIPATAFRLFVNILEQMAQGHAVALTSVVHELTTQQAADLLEAVDKFIVPGA